MAAANETRGEASLDLDGATYVMRPTYAARNEFQAATGKGVVRLAQDAATSSLTDQEMAAIATACIRAWGAEVGDKSAANVNADRIGEMMTESEGGMLVIMQQLKLMLFMAVTGGYTAKGEVKPAAVNTAPRPPAPKGPAPTRKRSGA